MVFPNVAKHTWLMPFAVCASFLVDLPVRGQTPPARRQCHQWRSANCEQNQPGMLGDVV